MAMVDLVMPKMGESIMEATVLKWHKKPGDFVKQDESVLEIATDKVDSEVPSTAEGVIQELLYNENDVVPVGAVIARIKVGVGEEREAEAERVQVPAQSAHIEFHPTRKAVVAEDDVSAEEIPYVPSHIPHTVKSEGARFYSPLVLNIAANEKIPMTELEHISGTGNEGRVTKRDILEYVAHRRNGAPPVAVPKAEPRPEPQPQYIEKPAAAAPKPVERKETPAPQPIQPIATISGGNVEIIEMDRMRRLISEHMVRSKATSAHVTSFSEADVTNLVLWREKNKKEFEKREGEKITFTPLFIEAIVHCLKKFPWLNSSVEGDKIIIKKDIHIGMATALPSGNLIVPVIKNADQLSLMGLTKQVNGLANSARTNKLRPDDTSGGTFTFTNVGTFGSLMGTPVINQPQVAILATGAIKKRPVVVETEMGDSIAIRHMMYVSMSYDHRIIDGSMGASFVTAVVKELESFDINRTF
ncbi:dihydrolipoamide acetyltransferase family protein [Pollutibacter soli]|uniref:dihydrolipoamide acetyltransferase family protein n=1 Tax=Pollutibacter soli TaxID=3034157 RepID=UPI003AF88697